MERLKFNLNGTWRISQINKDYQMCPSYPPQLLVPACISDEILGSVAKFRSSRRIPAVVWRQDKLQDAFNFKGFSVIIMIAIFRHANGAVIARSSQPEVGWLGWRSSEDEDLLKALAEACSYDGGDSNVIDAPSNCSDAGDEPIISNVTKVRSQSNFYTSQKHKKKSFYKNRNHKTNNNVNFQYSRNHIIATDSFLRFSQNLHKLGL